MAKQQFATTRQPIEPHVRTFNETRRALRKLADSVGTGAPAAASATVGVYDAAGGLALSPSAQTIPFNTEQFNSGEFSLAGGEVTINQAGVYVLNFHVTVGNTDTVELEAFAELNGVQIPGSVGRAIR